MSFVRVFMVEGDNVWILLKISRFKVHTPFTHWYSESCISPRFCLWKEFCMSLHYWRWQCQDSCENKQFLSIYSIHTDIWGQEDLLQACKSLGIKIPTLQHFQCQQSSIFCRLMVKGGVGFSNAVLVEESTLMSHWMLVHRMIHVLFRWPIHWLLLWE